MGQEQRDILETILRAKAPSGEEFTLVTFRGGGYGIVRNGTPIPDMHWANGQMKQCIDSLVRLAGLHEDGSQHR